MSISKDFFHAALNTYRDCVSQDRCYNQDSDFDFQVQNAETSFRYLFRPLVPSLRRVSIEEQDFTPIEELLWVMLTGVQDHLQLHIPTVNESCWIRLTSVLHQKTKLC
ncbi:uncharacterized protein PHALS_10527 [Plasmopara halstedii]|uniref:Uncharacterized protein n=1 Tax=Plasmopara halstedii TaxID=4781 RepID=A0A0P1AGQ4_PLAHL|nr:uncharacterized protein PHALS_10527 [Plasmopara halstedii]CEG40321.1 hypothetical protein PHALS_10527 [Plasmopara halstedii]|eukprot:XP_024576690.1 hypothetical protein PHALS_10527 [Plasmopara halstedii]